MRRGAAFTRELRTGWTKRQNKEGMQKEGREPGGEEGGEERHNSLKTHQTTPHAA